MRCILDAWGPIKYKAMRCVWLRKGRNCCMVILRIFWQKVDRERKIEWKRKRSCDKELHRECVCGGGGRERERESAR